MTELLGLLKMVETWPVKPSLYITSRKIWLDELEKLGPTYVVGECNRNEPLKILITILKSFFFLIREKPEVIITTGSLPIAIVCVEAKILLRSKIIWIDSIAQLDDLSMSGKLMLKYADVLITQWPEVAERYEKAEYVGELL